VWRKSEGFRRKKFSRVLVEAPSQSWIRSKKPCNIFESWIQIYLKKQYYKPESILHLQHQNRYFRLLPLKSSTRMSIWTNSVEETSVAASSSTTDLALENDKILKKKKRVLQGSDEGY